MPATVFVGDIPEDTRRSDIEHFLEKSKYGKGKYESIRMRRRFGFVDFHSSRDADDFIRDMEGERLLDQRVRLEVADSLRSRGRGERGSRSRSRGRGGGGGGGRGRPHRTKYCLEVDNLSSRINWMDLKDLFRQVGEVTYTDANQKLGRNRGEVCFANREDMDAARKKFDGHELNGREIKVRVAEQSRSRSRSRGGDRGGRGGGKRRSSRSSSSSRSRSRSRSPRRSRNRRDTRSKSAASKSRSRSRGRRSRS